MMTPHSIKNLTEDIIRKSIFMSATIKTSLYAQYKSDIKVISMVTEKKYGFIVIPLRPVSMITVPTATILYGDIKNTSIK